MSSDSANTTAHRGPGSSPLVWVPPVEHLPRPRTGAQRAYCLAESLGVTLPELLEELRDLGFRGCTPSSLIELATAREVTERLHRRVAR
ncbi:hypothetical protein SAMN05444320_115109 [Streptoalloteichus hindustanus]|uniref:Uncharacterized protein n=1 Tax=Streptoalloteichus hindustanus TaxID=2017 RepID=A0A1M5NE24_STRHI|nr:hypothetical protein SAMN05444320_115109 [Streptoalloteichus hindustanus]